MLDTKTGGFRIVATITLLWCGTRAFFKIFMTRSGKTIAIVLALLRKLFSSTEVKVIGRDDQVLDMDTSLLSGIGAGALCAVAWCSVPSFREDGRWHKISLIHK